MTTNDINTFLKQLKYDRAYARKQIFCTDWYDLVENMVQTKPYRLLYSPQQLTRNTEFIEFLDGNGFKIIPLYHIAENIMVQIVRE